MIQYDKFTLKNGLRVLVHKDDSTPIVAVNVLYDVGARDENIGRTGFAHLFEHLMFGGSINIPNYDEPLQRVGGQNNAFTNNDFTNYYITLPKDNLETAFWLESDRMLSLAFTPKSLEVQRNVVVEEFKQRYLNQPYGDAMLELRPLAYQHHPYRWATIGQDISHIENATMDEVKAFFKRNYHPANAILVVAGNVQTEEVKDLAEKWFGPIPRVEKEQRNLPQELPQTEQRSKTLLRKVPQDALYLAWHMPDRLHKNYYACDLISDLLSSGKSSRLKENLVKKQNVFTSVDAYILGSLDPGLFIVSGHISAGVNHQQAKDAVLNEIQQLLAEGPSAEELEKVKNKIEANMVFSEINVLSKAINLAYFELLGDASKINTVTNEYRKITREDIQNAGKQIFTNENLSCLFYKATDL